MEEARKMKGLIVNADDLGADQARNEGIFDAIRGGCITGVSLLANGPAFNDAVDRIRSLGPTTISFGVHINLSEGNPISSDLHLLTGKNGEFLGRKSTHGLLMNGTDPSLLREIAREMSAQIKTIIHAGVPINHLDGHQHVHIFPAAVAAAVQMAREYRIPWVRMPEETPPHSLLASPFISDVEEGRRFSGIAEEARHHLKGTEIRTTQHFVGLYIKGKLSLPLLRQLLHPLPEGLTELMVHPGRAPAGAPSGPFARFSTTQREQELQTLLNANFHRMVKEAGFDVVPFPDVPLGQY